MAGRLVLPGLRIGLELVCAHPRCNAADRYSGWFHADSTDEDSPELIFWRGVLYVPGAAHRDGRTAPLLLPRLCEHRGIGMAELLGYRVVRLLFHGRARLGRDSQVQSFLSAGQGSAPLRNRLAGFPARRRQSTHSDHGGAWYSVL